MRNIINLVKKKIGNYYLLLINFSYLSLLQIFNLALPLITYPYLIKILGSENYGMIIYSQTVVSYLVVLVNFGFNITATKEISIHRNDKEKVTEIVSSVYLLKGLLFICTFFILFLILSLSPEYKNFKLLFFLTQWMCLYEFLFPLWYFQGVEKMKYITVLTLSSRITFVILIFLLVQSNSDYLRIPIINGIGSIISCVGAFVILKREKIRFEIQKKVTLLLYAKKSYVMAIAYLTNIFKTNFNIIIAKHFFSYKEVIYFDIANKVVNICTTFLDLISQTVFPKMSILKDKLFLRKMLLISFFTSVAMMLTIQLFAPFIVKLLGGDSMEPAIGLTRILSLNLPVYIVGALLGRNCLLVHGYEKKILYSMLYSSLVYIILILITTVLFKKIELRMFAFIFLASFLFETIYRYKACANKKII